MGQLSMNAKEWKPGMSFQPTSQLQQGNTTTATAATKSDQNIQRQSSLSTTSSPWVPATTNLSASGINVNASNWIPQSQQPQLQSQPQSIIHEHLDNLTKNVIHDKHDNNNDTNNNNNNNNNSKSSIPSGAIPFPHQQTFTMNNPITLPLPKTLANTTTTNNNYNYNNNHDNNVPTTHLLSKLYRLYHIDCTNQMEPNDELYKAIPQTFVNAMPLENNNNNKKNKSNHNKNNKTNTTTTTTNTRDIFRSSFGYPSSTFKVTNIDNGRLYCLRRFDNVKCVNGKIASHVSNMWNHAITNQHHHQQQHVLNHPGIVRFYKAFYINQNRALFFIHEYYPNALTLREALFGLKRGDSGKFNTKSSSSTTSTTTGGGSSSSVGNGSNVSDKTFHPLHEGIIWSYVTQLVSAIKSVHLGGLAVRALQLNHILVTNDVGSGFVDETALMESDNTTIERNFMTNRVRLRLNCIGIVDALEFESRKEVEFCQKEDMRCLGRIILSLASGLEIGHDADNVTLDRCEAYMRQAYSADLFNLTNALLARRRMGRLGNLVDVDPPNIQNVCRVVGEHALDELDSVHVNMDKMDEALASEYESGRGLRLLLKLGFINERPEFGVDTRWSETGDCFVLKLFRDYGKILYSFFLHFDGILQ